MRISASQSLPNSTSRSAQVFLQTITCSPKYYWERDRRLISRFFFSSKNKNKNNWLLLDLIFVLHLYGIIFVLKIRSWGIRKYSMLLPVFKVILRFGYKKTEYPSCGDNSEPQIFSISANYSDTFGGSLEFWKAILWGTGQSDCQSALPCLRVSTSPFCARLRAAPQKFPCIILFFPPPHLYIILHQFIYQWEMYMICSSNLSL